MKIKLLLAFTIIMMVAIVVGCSDETNVNSPNSETISPQGNKHNTSFAASVPSPYSDGYIDYTYTPVLEGISHLGIIFLEFSNTQANSPSKSFQEHPEYVDSLFKRVVGQNYASADVLYKI